MSLVTHVCLPELILSAPRIGPNANDIGRPCALNPLTGHLPPRLANVNTCVHRNMVQHPGFTSGALAMSSDLKKERYENVTTMIRYHNDKMVEAFVRFIKFSVGVIAGSIGFISLGDVGQDSLGDVEQELKKFILFAVPVIFWFMGISFIAIIFSNWKSWLGFREAEAEILNMPSLKPKPLRSKSEQIIMFVIISLACVFVTYVYCRILPSLLSQK